MSKRTIAMLTVFLFLTGCKHEAWVKEGSTEEEFQRRWDFCASVAMLPEHENDDKDVVFRACMGSGGWHQEEKEW